MVLGYYYQRTVAGMRRQKMAKYRKQPIIVDAVQVTKELIMSWVNNQISKPKEVLQLEVWWEDGIINEKQSTFGGMLATLEGNMEFKIGDWLIRGIAGELYPCKDEIFKVTYESVNEPGTIDMPN
jgi:hypothetical protein